MKLSTILCVVLLFSSSAFSSVPATAKVCVFEGAQSRSWSISCDGKKVDAGMIPAEESISGRLAMLIDLGFSIRACNGFPNSLGIRCVLTK